MNLCCDIQSLSICDYDAGEGLGRQPCLGDLQRIEETYSLAYYSYIEVKRISAELLNTRIGDPRFVVLKRELERETAFLSQVVNGLAEFSSNLNSCLGIPAESRFFQLRTAVQHKISDGVRQAEELASEADFLVERIARKIIFNRIISD
jgi:hypothetical protein